jgi:O-antigen/teichoic acid export membrane protein
MTSTVLTGALGVIFWVVAARSFPAAAVGQASAALSAMTFLAGLAELNIVRIFIRFIPEAGPATARFIRRGYGLTVATGLVLAAAFLALGFGHGFLGTSWVVLGGFLLATVLYSIFFVQDGVLTALGAAVWVPLENLLFGVLRVILLLALATISQQWGILLALPVPIVIAVVVVNWYIFMRLVPRHVAGSHRSAHIDWAQIKGFVAADYAASALASCVALLPPVLVAAVLGADVTAYFYVPWFIGVSFSTLLWSVVMPFVVESARAPHAVALLIRRTARLVAVVSGAACVITTLAGPVILATLGSAYAAEGVTTLKVIAASFPFTALITFYAALCLLRQTLKALVVIQAIKAALFLASSVLTLRWYGIEGLAVTYLVLEGTAAMLLVPRTRDSYRLLTSAAADDPSRVPPSEVRGAPVPTNAAPKTGNGAPNEPASGCASRDLA